MPSSPQAGTPPAASFDNFYSPRNVSFYASKPYALLNRSAKEIRLIRILPGNDDDPLGCELLPAQRLEEVKYKYLALSYCAGDPTQTSSINIAGLQFNVFASLGVALRRLRRVESAEEHLLWVDQICIDQSDTIERAHQVGIMRDIYESASKVLVWLGGKGDAELGLALLQNEYDRLKYTLDSLGIDITDRENPYVLAAIAAYNAEVGKRREEKGFDNPGVIGGWTALEELVSNPWWGRCWIAQELIVSRNAILLLGDVAMSWTEFKISYELITATCKTIAQPAMSRQHYEPVTEHELRNLKQAERVHNFNILSLISQQSEWERGNLSGIRTVLNHARHAQSSDRRDRIYAFLGLCDPGYDIAVSYEPSNTPGDTFCHAAKQIIRHDSSLDILGYVSQPQAVDGVQLPSWVPEWLSPYVPLCEDRNEHKASGSYRATTSFHPDAQGQNDRILRVTGVIVDQVAAKATYVKPTKKNSMQTLVDWKAILNIRDSRQDDSQLYFTGQDLMLATVDTLHLGQYRTREKDTTDLDETAQNLNRYSVTIGGRHFFRTPKGYIGVVSGAAQHTDVVAVLFGAPMPLVLRKTGDQYVLIGEAYVHGFKDGEAIKMMERGELHVQQFDII